MNTFNEALHEYRIAGKIVPSVTQVCDSLNLVDKSWFTPASREKGTFIHDMCAMYDRGELDEGSLDSQLLPYLDAWKAFRKQMPVTFAVIEQPFYSLEYGFAGTIDRAWFEVKKGVVGDIKSGVMPETIDLQLAGYSILFPSLTGMGIQLKDNGKFSLKPVGLLEMARARNRFMEALRKVQAA